MKPCIRLSIPKRIQSNHIKPNSAFPTFWLSAPML